MKYFIYYTIGIVLFALVLFSCKSNENKTGEINSQIESTSAQVSEEQRKMKKEYNEFKEYALGEIYENEDNIEKLRIKINASGKTIDEARHRRVLDLQEQNKELRYRFNSYAMNTNDWQSFKAKFNADLKNVGDSFKDLLSGS